jgi:hypothetical protein
MIPIWIDGGYRLNPHAYLGAYLDYGIGFVNASAQVPCRASGAHCSASDVLFGVDVGPFATLAVAQYADCSNSGSPSMCAVGAKTTHEVFVVGVRGTYDIRVK